MLGLAARSCDQGFAVRSQEGRLDIGRLRTRVAWSVGVRVAGGSLAGEPPHVVPTDAPASPPLCGSPRAPTFFLATVLAEGVRKNRIDVHTVYKLPGSQGEPSAIIL